MDRWEPIFCGDFLTWALTQVTGHLSDIVHLLQNWALNFCCITRMHTDQNMNFVIFSRGPFVARISFWQWSHWVVLETIKNNPKKIIKFSPYFESTGWSVSCKMFGVTVYLCMFIFWWLKLWNEDENSLMYIDHSSEMFLLNKKTDLPYDPPSHVPSWPVWCHQDERHS